MSSSEVFPRFTDAGSMRSIRDKRNNVIKHSIVRWCFPYIAEPSSHLRILPRAGKGSVSQQTWLLYIGQQTVFLLKSWHFGDFSTALNRWLVTCSDFIQIQGLQNPGLWPVTKWSPTEPCTIWSLPTSPASCVSTPQFS